MHFQTTLTSDHVANMVEFRSASSEIRGRKKKEERKKKAWYVGRPSVIVNRDGRNRTQTDVSVMLGQRWRNTVTSARNILTSLAASSRHASSSSSSIWCWRQWCYLTLAAPPLTCCCCCCECHVRLRASSLSSLMTSFSALILHVFTNRCITSATREENNNITAE